MELDYATGKKAPHSSDGTGGSHHPVGPIKLMPHALESKTE